MVQMQAFVDKESGEYWLALQGVFRNLNTCAAQGLPPWLLVLDWVRCSACIAVDSYRYRPGVSCSGPAIVCRSVDALCWVGQCNFSQWLYCLADGARATGREQQMDMIVHPEIRMEWQSDCSSASVSRRRYRSCSWTAKEQGSRSLPGSTAYRTTSGSSESQLR